jgi:superfamily II DNA/RNA helicase
MFDQVFDHTFYRLVLTAQLGCLHSGLEPDKKQAQLRRFNRGELRALLLTDAYGLGMDFKDVDVVLGVSCFIIGGFFLVLSVSIPGNGLHRCGCGAVGESGM